MNPIDITPLMRMRPSRPPASAHSAGFTLIELMITLVVTGIMLAIGLPAFSSMTQNSKLSGQVDELNSMLNYARNAALSQNSPVQVCPVGANGSTTCGSNWATGWMVVTAPTNGTTPVLLQSHTIVPTTITLAVSSTIVTPNWIVFDPHGLTTNTANFAFCDSRGEAYARTAYLVSTGAVQTAKAGIAAWSGTAVATTVCSTP